MTYECNKIKYQKRMFFQQKGSTEIQSIDVTMISNDWTIKSLFYILGFWSKTEQRWEEVTEESDVRHKKTTWTDAEIKWCYIISNVIEYQMI